MLKNVISDLKRLKNFYCVKIEYSGNILVGWGGGRALSTAQRMEGGKNKSPAGLI